MQMYITVLGSGSNMRMNAMAADVPPLPYHEKSDSEKDRLFKNIAEQLDRIANDIDLAHSAPLKSGQLSLM